MDAQLSAVSNPSLQDEARLRTAHVLFADIIGYSLLATDEQSRVVSQLQSFIRDLPGFNQAYAAEEVICIPTGDGLAMVCFGEPTLPAQFATRIAIRVRNEAQFGLRLGLHSGPVYCAADINGHQNVSGGGINTAQRVMDCADAGHILVSEAMADTLRQLSQWRDSIQDLGECEVKHGVLVHIFNLCGPEFGNAAIPGKILRAREAKAAPVAPPAEAPVIPSIAVLPFANIGGDKENEYFSDGLSEEILNLLSKVSNLRVIARTSAFAFRGKQQDIREIAAILGARHVLEGSVRKAGNRVRVSTQLIEAESGSLLWSERYDRDLTDIFAVQDEIGSAIADALNVQLTSRKKKVNIEAWQCFLKGQYHHNRFTPDDLMKAREYFEQAIAIDPAYAEAYSGLASHFDLMGALGVAPEGSLIPLAGASAEKALQLDPTDSEANSVLATIAGLTDYDWRRAEKYHRLALAANPVPPFVRFRYNTCFLYPHGRIAEADEQCRLGLDVDPLSVQLNVNLVWALYVQKKFQEAIERAQALSELIAHPFLLLNRGQAQLLAGQNIEAVASLERFAEFAPWWRAGTGTLAAAYHRAGDVGRGREVARKLFEAHGLCFAYAWYCAAADNPDLMFEALHGAVARRDTDLRGIQCDPIFEPYRDDPGFTDILRKMNLA